MTEDEITKLIRSLNPLMPDLYKVMDQFHEQASDEWDLNIKKTVTELGNMINFLAEQLSEDLGKTPPS